MKQTRTKIEDALNLVDRVLYETNWHMPLPEPRLTILMIEAKAKLIEANKKLEKVLQSMPETV
jgi:hypothetical protein